jgi:uncharacterized glyoxalase superfamily protein PhnB
MTDPLDNLAAPSTDERPSVEFTDRLRNRVEAIEARADRARQATTSGARWHLAQLNLGLFKAPLDAPEMAPFAAALDRINALADESPGFVWRLKDDDGGPSSYVDVPGEDDPLMASNLSVWTDLESLRSFMYRTDHAAYLRRRNEWFQRHDEAMTVAWWIPAGTVPTLEEAMQRLDRLRADGPSDSAFPLTRNIPDPPAAEPQAPEEATMSSGLRSQLIPYLTVGDSRAALDFYAEVLGAVEQGEPHVMDDGRIGHIEFDIGDQRFYMADEFPEMNLRTPDEAGSNAVSMVIEVADCDAVYHQAVLAGGTGERPPANQHGFRSGWFRDPWGHRWSPTSAVKPDAD